MSMNKIRLFRHPDFALPDELCFLSTENVDFYD